MILTSITEKGAYALHLKIASLKVLQIGKLGIFTFPPGDYVYLGSALGPGGLRGRVDRHVRGLTSFHWHIDWLRQAATPVGCCYAITDERLECQWSKTLAACRDAIIPAQGFGASGCRTRTETCKAHLVMFEAGVTPNRLRDMLASGSEMPLEYSPFTFVSLARVRHME